MSEQELDLIQFATRSVTQTGTGASEIVRRQLVDAGARTTSYNNLRDN